MCKDTSFRIIIKHWSIIILDFIFSTNKRRYSHISLHEILATFLATYWALLGHLAIAKSQ